MPHETKSLNKTLAFECRPFASPSGKASKHHLRQLVDLLLYKHLTVDQPIH
jgi:hypothetical protein